MTKKKCRCYAGEPTLCGDCDKEWVQLDPRILPMLEKLREYHIQAGCQPHHMCCVLCAVLKYAPKKRKEP